MELIYYLIDERILQLVSVPTHEAVARTEELIALKMRIAELEKRND